MGLSFYPTPEDVERYRIFRTLSMDLCDRIVKTIPGRAYDEIGNALGIRHKDILVFDTEDVASVLMDCCIFDWFEDGRNLVQRYADTCPAAPETDESFLLNGYCRATYGILAVLGIVRGSGLHCRDVLNGGELFLMDIALSQTLPAARAALATRIIPLGRYSMTSGAGLPLQSETDFAHALSKGERGKKSMADPSGISLSIVRACLDRGAANNIRYEEPIRRPGHSPRMPRWPGPRRRRRKL
jgi:hypothetical protein